MRLNMTGKEKLTAVCAVLLVIFNIGMLYAAPDSGVADTAPLINAHAQNLARIAALERRITGLKIDSASGAWNFIGRSSNERNIQMRARLLREIFLIKDENLAIADSLIKNYPEMSKKFLAGSSEPGFIDAISYIEALSAGRMSELRFLDINGADSSLKDPSRLEFLRYRAELQALKLGLIETLYRTIKAHKTACEGRDSGGYAAKSGIMLGELGNLISEAKKRQEELKKYLASVR